MPALNELTTKLIARNDLALSEVQVAVTLLSSMTESDGSKEAFLIALADKGETPAELAAFATAYRELAVNPGVDAWADRAIDIVGTGGDHAGGFNISSIVILVLASAGVPVMKHGNRGITSKSGSADLLAALGVDITASPEKARQALAALGYVFFFAPNYHPAFKHIAPVRKALAAQGRRSIFNILGPLINPGRPAHILLGVYSKPLVAKMASALEELQQSAGLVAHGVIGENNGIDELTTATANHVQGVGRLRDINGFWLAEDMGLAKAPFSELVGGDVAANLAIVEAILAGRGPGGLVDTIVLNAAVGLYTVGRVASVREGIAPVRDLLLGGAVAQKSRTHGNSIAVNPMASSRKYFGTDGVRGHYGSAMMNEDFAWRLGVAAARWLQEKGAKGGNVFIGRDTRVSGASLAQALADGFAHAGFSPVSLEVLPTPAVSRAVRVNGAALGAVVTASHNPATDNGLKFFGPNGIKLTDEDEARIESFLPASREDSTVVKVSQLDVLSNYFDSMKGILPGTLAGWKIVLDTANGATVHTSSRVLRDYGAEVFAIGSEFDGVNINRGVGSEHPEKMCAAVKLHGARLGIAHDGDGDRCILCDERGSVLDGDEILTILALHALKQGTLVNKTLVATVQSNLGVEAAVKAAGGRVVRTPVGDRYVIERMLTEGATLGGESSGHVICSDISPTGDGLVAALKVIEVMLVTGRPLSELRQVLVKFPQLSSALTVKEKKPVESLPTLPKVILAVEAELGSAGRVLVRYSGTESKLRVLVEGPTHDIVKFAMEKLVSTVRADLEVIKGD